MWAIFDSKRSGTILLWSLNKKTAHFLPRAYQQIAHNFCGFLFVQSLVSPLRFVYLINTRQYIISLPSISSIYSLAECEQSMEVNTKKSLGQNGMNLKYKSER